MRTLILFGAFKLQIDCHTNCRSFPLDELEILGLDLSMHMVSTLDKMEVIPSEISCLPVSSVSQV